MTQPRPRLSRPRLLTIRLVVLLIPLLSGILAAGVRTAAAANLVSYWGWPEAICVAVCVEGAELAFLLRFIWTRDAGRQDWLSAAGMLIGIAASIAYSALLAFSAIDRLTGTTLALGRYAVITASVAINIVSYLLSRELARYVVEYERDLAGWEDRQLRRAERRAATAERQADRERTAPPPPVRPRTAADKKRTLLDCYRTRPDWTVDELRTLMDCGRTRVYEIRHELVQDGLISGNGDGYKVRA